MQYDLTNSFKVSELEVRLKPRRSYFPVSLHNPQDVYDFLAPHFKDSPREHLICISISSTTLAGMEVVSIGTSDQSLAPPREILKAVILTNAASMIIAHNHPSGCLDPSDNDLQLARTLNRAADLFDVKLLDFLIISHRGWWSLQNSNPLWRDHR